jgi:glycerophosphoryl diester phosphodiesterase
MVLIVGHRGARDLWPENSLDGFRRSRDLGVDAVEFDVHLARDGGLVVIHDPTLERTVEATGTVADRTVAQLAASPLRKAGGEGVPSLEAVLDVFAGTPIELQIEIKTDALGSAYLGLEAKLIELIARRGLGERTILTSFVPGILETVRRLDPGQRLLASLDRRSSEMMGGLAPALDRFAAIGGCMVAVEKSLLAASLDFCVERLGSERLGAWVTNEIDEIAAWMAKPIRQITTDRPDLALRLRGR